ncbi:MAG: hypothetical protein INR73_00650 [Williamsia sp.]|nr:hypothetical protein [Williamsia sp.]
MEQEVFVLAEVGEFYNNHFISYRLNAEKGEGPALSKTYSISAYPTWLYLESSGTLRSRQTDYMGTADFISSGLEALGKDSVSVRLSAYEARFSAGERSPAFLQTYARMRTVLQLDNTAVLDAWVNTRKKAIPDTDELRFLVQNSGRSWSAAVPLIVNNLQRFGMEEQNRRRRNPSPKCCLRVTPPCGMRHNGAKRTFALFPTEHTQALSARLSGDRK